ncbi:MAG: hypothetical protein MUC92_09670 [Fimbriimonadaceae bacterium]|nr:hypothetical protein [Fimbriimonadaceae bacterium]
MRVGWKCERGLSLVEVLASAALGSLLLGSAMSLFFVVSKRVALDGSDAAVAAQVNLLMHDLSMLVKNGRKVSVSSNGKSSLTVHGYYGGSDTNFDRLADTGVPTALDASGAVSYPATESVAIIFWADWPSSTTPTNPRDPTTGVVASSGSDLSLGFLDNGVFTIDSSLWRVNGKPRYNLIKSVTFSGAGTRAVTVTIVAEALPNTRSTLGSTSQAQRSKLTLTRTLSTTRGL